MPGPGEIGDAAKEAPGLFGLIATAVLAIFTWLGNKVWRGHRHEIGDMKQAHTNLAVEVKEKVDKEDFKDYVARAEKSREELRESQITLFAKVDGLRDHVDEKFDRLADLIRERK